MSIAHDYRAIAEALAKITGRKLDQETRDDQRGVPEPSWEDCYGAPYFPADFEPHGY